MKVPAISSKKTLEVHDYIYSKNLAAQNGFKFSAHDTDVVWNLAILSNELKRKDRSFEYYKRSPMPTWVMKNTRRPTTKW